MVPVSRRYTLWNEQSANRGGKEKRKKRTAQNVFDKIKTIKAIDLIKCSFKYARMHLIANSIVYACNKRRFIAPEPIISLFTKQFNVILLQRQFIVHEATTHHNFHIVHWWACARARTHTFNLVHTRRIHVVKMLFLLFLTLGKWCRHSNESNMLLGGEFIKWNWSPFHSWRMRFYQRQRASFDVWNQSIPLHRKSNNWQKEQQQRQGKIANSFHSIFDSISTDNLCTI